MTPQLRAVDSFYPGDLAIPHALAAGVTTVCAGPGEATAIGNLLVQMISDGVFKNLKEARACVRDSFDIRQYRE